MVTTPSSSLPPTAPEQRPTELWRVRVALPDRPGALARLAQRCGDHEVNILGLEVHPGLGTVTDELVLAVPAGRTLADVVALVEEAGCRPELVGRAPASALADQAVRHLQAAARLVERPLAAARVVAGLLDAEVVTAPSGPGPVLRPRRAERHHLTLSVLGETMDLVRDAPFTPTEQARVDALVDLADRLAHAVGPPEPDDGARSAAPDRPDDGPTADRREPELRRHADAVIAEVDDHKVGEATLLPVGVGWGVRVYVHPAWRRRGIGLQLLREAMAVAVERGVHDLDVRLDAQDLAGLRLVLASGMCGSISCDSGVTRTRLVLARTARPVTA